MERVFPVVIAGQESQSKALASPWTATGTIYDLCEIINPLSWDYKLR